MTTASCNISSLFSLVPKELPKLIAVFAANHPAFFVSAIRMVGVSFLRKRRRKFSLSQMSRAKLAWAMPWRENLHEVNTLERMLAFDRSSVSMKREPITSDCVRI